MRPEHLIGALCVVFLCVKASIAFKIWHSEIDLLQAHESAKAEAKAGKLLRKRGEASQLQVPPNEEESESGSSGSPFVLESSDSADATRSTLTMDVNDSFLRNANEMDNY